MDDHDTYGQDYAILDGPEGSLATYIILGPLTEERTIKLSSDRLICVNSREELEAELDRRFKAPEGFRQWKLAHENPFLFDSVLVSRVVGQLGVSCREALNFVRGLTIIVVTPCWIATSTNTYLIAALARKVGVILVEDCIIHLTRYKGFVRGATGRWPLPELTAFHYDPAAWKEADRKKQDLKVLLEEIGVERKLIDVFEAKELFQSLARAITNRLTAGTKLDLMFSKPGRYKLPALRKLVDIDKFGKKTFGRKAWRKTKLEIRASVRIGEKWEYTYLIKGIAKRHKVVGLERPAHKRKLARAIWDVVYY
jgi:hypothetical protein